ncbi:hypothetical protein SBV1_2240023 [Verrucomicrobia bacterium]|nr:hypothetical protein SBV1_2240023 [Verrucomicrobiota bacterium]
MSSPASLTCKSSCEAERSNKIPIEPRARHRWVNLAFSLYWRLLLVAKDCATDPKAWICRSFQGDSAAYPPGCCFTETFIFRPVLGCYSHLMNESGLTGRMGSSVLRRRKC